MVRAESQQEISHQLESIEKQFELENTKYKPTERCDTAEQDSDHYIRIRFDDHHNLFSFQSNDEHYLRFDAILVLCTNARERDTHRWTSSLTNSIQSQLFFFFIEETSMLVGLNNP